MHREALFTRLDHYLGRRHGTRRTGWAKVNPTDQVLRPRLSDVDSRANKGPTINFEAIEELHTASSLMEDQVNAAALRVESTRDKSAYIRVWRG